jgi:hypothetical protein
MISEGQYCSDRAGSGRGCASGWQLVKPGLSVSSRTAQQEAHARVRAEWRLGDRRPEQRMSLRPDCPRVPTIEAVRSASCKLHNNRLHCRFLLVSVPTHSRYHAWDEWALTSGVRDGLSGRGIRNARFPSPAGGFLGGIWLVGGIDANAANAANPQTDGNRTRQPHRFLPPNMQP